MRPQATRRQFLRPQPIGRPFDAGGAAAGRSRHHGRSRSGRAAGHGRLRRAARTASCGSARLRAGTFTETDLGEVIRAPAHAEAVDLDRDGDLDIVVASLGVMFPSNAKIGVGGRARERRPRRIHQPRARQIEIARVSDVRAGDLDGDGDLDLAVAQFGYNDGETRWMENHGRLAIREHDAAEPVGPDQRRGGRSRWRRRSRYRLAREPGVGGGLRLTSTTGAAGSSRR